MMTPISGTSVELLQGDRWVFVMFVGDDDGDGVDSTPTVSVVAPDGSLPTVTVESLTSTGYFRASVSVALAGRYTAVATAAGYGAMAFSAYVEGVSEFDAFPGLEDVKLYLNQGEEDNDSTPEAVIEDALEAEAAAQRRVCNIGPIYGADLAQALKRRVARNLQMRGIPLAVLRGNAELGNLYLPGNDPEVRRLEAPYRKLVQP